MRVAIPRESYANERRVAATPATVKELRKLGLTVQIQAGAGEGASILDSAYSEAGAEIISDPAALWAGADLLLKVRAPTYKAAAPDQPSEVDLLREGAALVSFLWPAQNPELLERLKERKITALAMDMVPRITRAQKLDALSSMAGVAGYKAVIEAAHHYGRSLGGQSTAAGRIRPARVLIIGAGVAGLGAIAAAKALGAQVKAFDTRPVAREQVESLGAQFVELVFNESGDGEGGYAKQMSDAYLLAEQTLLAQHCAQSDIVITTALIPGKPAPQLITSGAVVGMGRGSVIIDLASEQGGNCALTERDKVVEKFGVTIVGLTDLPSRMAVQASELYAVNLLHLLRDIIEVPKEPKDPGEGEPRLRLSREDEVHRTMLATDKGEILWPPPRPLVRSGAPAPQKATAGATALPPKEVPAFPPWAGRLSLLALAALAVPLALYAPKDLLQHLTVFVLACVVGWHVVWNVTPALHTPLMSVTNAISGIILIGGLLLVGGQGLGPVTVLSVLAALLAAINVAGGFLVTQRMLRMFRK